MTPDPRLETGATVHVKATLLRSAIECTRLYSSSAGVKMLTGTVTAAERVMTSTNRRSTSITTRFEVPGKTYVKRLSLLNYAPGPAWLMHPPRPRPLLNPLQRLWPWIVRQPVCPPPPLLPRSQRRPRPLSPPTPGRKLSPSASQL